MSMKLRHQKKQKTKSSLTPQPLLPLLNAEDLRVERKGKRLYQTKLKDMLEPLYPGMFAAIEADSGDYFLGARMGEAIEKAKAKYPDKLVYIVRIGFRAAVSARNRMQI